MTLVLNLAATVLLIAAIVCGWTLLSRLKSSLRRQAGGRARVQGACGSQLEMGLELSDGRVARAICRAEGCGHNSVCLHAAGRLARGKSLQELLDIDAEAIRRAVGDLPEDHHHCAEAAARALHAASENCFHEADP